MIKKIHITRKFISRRVSCSFKENNRPEDTIVRVSNYLKQEGWEIKEIRERKGNYYFNAKRDKYVVSFDFDVKDDEWYVMIYIDDFIKALENPGSSR